MPPIHQALKLVPAASQYSRPKGSCHATSPTCPQQGLSLRGGTRIIRHRHASYTSGAEAGTQHGLSLPANLGVVPGSSTTGMGPIHQALKLVPAANHPIAPPTKAATRLPAASSQAPTLGGTRIILQKPTGNTSVDDVGTCCGAGQSDASSQQHACHSQPWLKSASQQPAMA